MGHAWLMFDRFTWRAQIIGLALEPREFFLLFCHTHGLADFFWATKDLTNARPGDARALRYLSNILPMPGQKHNRPDEVMRRDFRELVTLVTLVLRIEIAIAMILILIAVVLVLSFFIKVCEGFPSRQGTAVETDRLLLRAIHTIVDLATDPALSAFRV